MAYFKINSAFLANSVTFCSFVGLPNMGLVMKKPSMKFTLTIVIFVFASLILLKPASAVAQPLTDSVIINNFVFDSSGSPWLGDWALDIVGTDTAFFFLPGAPPGSNAKLSIWFSASADEVSRTFTHLSSGIYQLSCWAKSIQRGTGTALLVRNDTIIMTKVLGTIIDSTTGTLDTNWIQYFLTDTLMLTSSDSLQIMLTGAFGVSIYPATWKSLVNNITFLKLIPSNGVSVLPGSPQPLTIYPNPISYEATISFSTDDASPVNVSIYNLLGSEVARLYDGTLDAGNHSFTWDANGAASGAYVCVVRMNGQVLRVPVVVAK